tara:strand:- start:1306 stop:1530 length:225 start_codon:yes stop_codon:yes gene_type:complete
MVLDFLYQGGYGQFIWPAFIFTFAICLILYLKTKQELQKQEKIFFNARKQLDTVGIEAVSIAKEKKEALSSSPI